MSDDNHVRRVSIRERPDTEEGLDIDKLSPELYEQLKEVARQRLARQRAGQTLDCTALVHEAYLKLRAADPDLTGGTDHLLALASLVMRQILVDKARRRATDKRGSGALHVTLQEGMVSDDNPVVDIIELDGALRRLARRDTGLERLVMLRFFAGLSMPEAARVMNQSLRSTERDWERARVYLFRELKPDGS
ncbi:MAG: ECF-type sigma factor [Wenzhouxiangella sp.]|jgi:RNA polymerase sigma factor (TIGR02999 family)|nr:ECF-type sigma factor [Wenzhouxiangella sp.]